MRIVFIVALSWKISDVVNTKLLNIETGNNDVLNFIKG